MTSCVAASILTVLFTYWKGPNFGAKLDKGSNKQKQKTANPLGERSPSSEVKSRKIFSNYNRKSSKPKPSIKESKPKSPRINFARIPSPKDGSDSTRRAIKRALPGEAKHRRNIAQRNKITPTSIKLTTGKSLRHKKPYPNEPQRHLNSKYKEWLPQASSFAQIQDPKDARSASEGSTCYDQAQNCPNKPMLFGIVMATSNNKGFQGLLHRGRATDGTPLFYVK